MKRSLKTKKPKTKKYAFIPLERTNRGFILGHFKDDNGQDCSLQKSSTMACSIDEQHIWFGCDNSKSEFQFFPESLEAHQKFGYGWRTLSLEDLYPGCAISTPDRMHLSRKTVKKLLPYLQYFARTGQLPPPKN